MIRDQRCHHDPPARNHLELVPPEPAPVDLPLAPMLRFVDVTKLVAQLLGDGFVAGDASELAAAMDRGLCAVLDCPFCKREGLEYRPFVSPRMQAAAAPGSYRPVAICARCGVGAEF